MLFLLVGFDYGGDFVVMDFYYFNYWCGDLVRNYLFLVDYGGFFGGFFCGGGFGCFLLNDDG